VLFVSCSLLNAIVAFATICSMLLLFLLFFVQCSSLDVAALCSMLLLFLLFFARCSLLNVAAPFAVFCSTLLFFLLLLVQCCCSFYYSLFDVVTPFVVPCLTLLLFVLCLMLRLLLLFVFNVIRSSTSLLCCEVVAPLFFTFCLMLLPPLLVFWIDISPLIFCRCGRSYPNSSFLG